MYSLHAQAFVAVNMSIMAAEEHLYELELQYITIAQSMTFFMPGYTVLHKYTLS